MYKHKTEQALRKTIKDLGFVVPNDPLLSISEKPQFGDYSSNIALQLSKQEHKNSYQNPREIANAIIEHLGHPQFLERVELAGPGFLNFFIKDSSLAEVLIPGKDDEDVLRDPEDYRTIIVEYCEPNTHKMLHIGHLLSLVLGEAMSRLFEYQGHEVIRTNYGSDIGLTVAKCIWGIEQLNDEYKKAKVGTLREKAEFLGKAYAYAHSEYEKSLEVKEKIDQITNKLYQRDESLIPIWEETKDWSLGYFEIIYSIFGTLFDRRINESEVDQLGKKIVLENVGKIFVKDEGAIIFPGTKYNLHNRVFINSKGNPTYEGKDVGLQEKYQELYQYDQVNIFSHKEQDDYFKVIIKANETVFPQLRGKINHVSHGEVKLSSGKMSSRTGNVFAAEDMYNQARDKLKTISPQLDELSIQKLAVASIKFAFLKYSPMSDIVYNLEESVSLHGDTGPYVIYVYARIMSLLKKAGEKNRANDSEPEEDEEELQGDKIAQKPKSAGPAGKQPHSTASFAGSVQALNGAPRLPSPASLSLDPEEREVLRQLEYFEFAVQKATSGFHPNELTKYLLNLTKAFNSFYENQAIIGSKTQDFRLLLCSKVAETIKLGLYLLGIETVDRM